MILIDTIIAFYKRTLQNEARLGIRRENLLHGRRPHDAMIIWTAFIFGLFNSLHCLGMCGPIALSLPVPAHINRAVAILFYNSGRIFTYSMMGLLFGSIGHAVVLFGFQRYLSITCGVLMLTFVLLQLSGVQPEQYLKGLSFVNRYVKSHFNALYLRKTLPSLFFIGLLNGLLPCGIVYLALAGAAAMGNSAYGALYMAVFGLGTVPVMGFISFFKNTQLLSNINLNKLIPIFTIVTAILLVLRGMNLNIPYISPALTENKVRCCTPKNAID